MGGATGGGGTDPYFAFVRFLLPLTGTEGGTSFPDVIGNTWTPNGTAETTTATSKFGGGCANFLSGGYLSAAASSQFVLGTDPFVFECFHNDSSPQINQCIFDTRNGSNNGRALYTTDGSGNGYLRVFDNAGLLGSTSPSAWALSTWNYLAWVRDASGNCYLYLDENLAGTFTDMGGSDATAACFLGANYLGGQGVNSYLNYARLTVGVDRGMTGSTIVVPTAPFPTS